MVIQLSFTTSIALLHSQGECVSNMLKCNRIWVGRSCATFGREIEVRSGTRRQTRCAVSAAESAEKEPSPSRSDRGQVVLVTGKFDTFHRGHRALVETAAGLGHPMLLSFPGMAEALKWPPRAPVVAPVERAGILREWGFALSCPVSWRTLRFDDVRNMPPERFVDYIKEELNVTAIVSGTDWRFGKGAKGDVQLLRALAAERMMKTSIVEPVLFKGEPISSTRVRAALMDGDVELAGELMDRPHRLVGYVSSLCSNGVTCVEFVNQVPREGTYAALIRVIGAAQPVRTTVRVSQADVQSDRSENAPSWIVTIDDATQIYCEDCEVYIDFISKVR